MNLSNLKPAKGSTHNSKRVGRGQGSGKGGTSKKGHKGAQSRSGYSRKFGFEGGQMPLQRRIPKRGFKNINRTDYEALNVGQLQYYADKYKVDTINIEFLTEKNIIQKSKLVKVLGNGELKTKLNISAHAISKSAQEKVEKAGGSFTEIK
ncbi:MAG: 50S ribosomal protein L15 [Bacteroidetes bacterium]|nr:50S ribosomal protein L15 [Bacteroidota bacterium]MCB9226896.1 50S ribosomal protein L15 [Chitinophagales bacterium]